LQKNETLQDQTKEMNSPNNAKKDAIVPIEITGKDLQKK
jgi:hypothetical protein